MTHIHGCTGKLKLPNAEIARDRARRMRQGHRGIVVAYHCRHCGSWHIGGLEEHGAEAKSRQYKRRKAEVQQA